MPLWNMEVKSMRIVVCIKQIPETGTVKFDPVTKNLIRTSVRGIINRYDKHAIEAAVQIKEMTGCEVVVISMGPEQFKESLKEALAMGCDSAVLLSSKAFGGADTLATGYVLSRAVEKIGGADIVFFGQNTLDSNTGQVGPITAEYLGMPQVTFVGELSYSDGAVEAVRYLDTCRETVRVSTPTVITVTDELNIPRIAKPINIIKAGRREIPVWDETALECDPERIGKPGSPTVVTSVYEPEKGDGHAEMIEGDIGEAADRILELFRSKA